MHLISRGNSQGWGDCPLFASLHVNGQTYKELMRKSKLNCGWLDVKLLQIARGYMYIWAVKWTRHDIRISQQLNRNTTGEA